MLESQFKVYQMSDEVRGRVLIININSFYNNGRLSNVREGSDIDYYNISKLFRDMRFEIVKKESDLTNLNADVSDASVQCSEHCLYYCKVMLS